MGRDLLPNPQRPVHRTRSRSLPRPTVGLVESVPTYSITPFPVLTRRRRWHHPPLRQAHVSPPGQDAPRSSRRPKRSPGPRMRADGCRCRQSGQDELVRRCGGRRRREGFIEQAVVPGRGRGARRARAVGRLHHRLERQGDGQVEESSIEVVQEPDLVQAARHAHPSCPSSLVQSDGD